MAVGEFALKSLAWLSAGLMLVGLTLYFYDDQLSLAWSNVGYALLFSGVGLGLFVMLVLTFEE